MIFSVLFRLIVLIILLTNSNSVLEAQEGNKTEKVKIVNKFFSIITKYAKNKK